MLANGEAPSWPCAAAAGLGVPGKLRAQAEVAGKSLQQWSIGTAGAGACRKPGGASPLCSIALQKL